MTIKQINAITIISNTCISFISEFTCLCDFGADAAVDFLLMLGDLISGRCPSTWGSSNLGSRLRPKSNMSVHFGQRIIFPGSAKFDGIVSSVKQAGQLNSVLGCCGAITSADMVGLRSVVGMTGDGISGMVSGSHVWASDDGWIGSVDSGSLASGQSKIRSCSVSWHFLHNVIKLLCWLVPWLDK